MPHILNMPYIPNWLRGLLHRWLNTGSSPVEAQTTCIIQDSALMYRQKALKKAGVLLLDVRWGEVKTSPKNKFLLGLIVIRGVLCRMGTPF